MLNNNVPTGRSRKEYVGGFSSKLLKHLIIYMEKVSHIEI
jgi:hypothetical protein